MKKLWISAACGALALSACSQSNDSNDKAYEDSIASAEVADASAPAAGSANEAAAIATRSAADPAQAPDTARTTNAMEVSDRAAPESSISENAAPPAVPTSVSPRVAFAHDYKFELPGKRISAIQEKHGRLCQELGTTQCEITDMDYRLEEGGAVKASTSFLLAPQVANLFGASAIAAVDQADGKLIEGGMRGEDAGGLIEESKAQNAERTRNITALEQQAKFFRPGSAERMAIENDIRQLRGENEQGLRDQASARARLARTPVTFTYKDGSGLFGSGDGLFANSSDNVGLSSLNAMLSLVALVAPWLLLIGAIAWAWRRFGSGKRNAAAAPASNATSSTGN